MNRAAGFAFPSWLAIGALAAVAAYHLEARVGGSTRRRLWRAFLMLLAAVALAGPRLDAPKPLRTVLVVDRSASVDPAARDLALSRIDPDADLERLDFGDALSSPLGRALDLAAERIGGGRLLLLGDGLWTDPVGPFGAAPMRDPRLAAAAALARGWRVDVLSLPARRSSGAALLGVRHVERLRQGDPLPVTLGVSSAAAGRGRLELWSAGARVLTQNLDLEAGRQEVALVLGGLQPGAWTFEARLVLEDSGEDPSVLRFGAVVARPPAVLVLGDAEAAEPVATALSAAGLAAASGGWGDLSARLSALAEWDTVVLLDAPADRLGIDQLASLEARVRERGCGLLLTAGPHSFDAGGWRDTLLERVSPLSVEVPSRRSREPVSLTFLVDRSASMGSVEGRGRVAKIDLARDAVLLASEALDPGDQVGVVAFDAAAEWLLPPAVLGEGRERSEIEAMLAGLATRGGTGITAALDLALPAVGAQQGMTSRHVVLVTDGQDFNADRSGLVADVSAARRAGLTLSAIAVGREADRSLLELLAAAGGGRFHAASEPGDLPALALAESQIVRSGAEQRGSFRASPPAGPWQPLLAGIDVSRLPPLSAYRALAARKGVRPALETSSGDPILVDWTWGLGRVAAWTSGFDDDWAPGWLEGEAGRALLASVVRQIARPPDVAPPMAFQDARPGGTRLRVLTDGDPEGERFMLHLVPPAGPREDRLLTQVTADRFETLAAVPPGEVWPARLQSGGGPASDLLLEAPVSVETVPGLAADASFLAEVAAAGGGRVLTAAETGVTLRQGRAPSWHVSNLILALLAVLWGVEVAWLLRGSRAGTKVPGPDAGDPTPSSGDRP